MNAGSIPAALFTNGACHGDAENSGIPFGDPTMYFSFENRCIKEVIPFPASEKKSEVESPQR